MEPTQQIPDGALLAALLAGDAEAYRQLVARYQRPLWRVARSRLGRDDWAEDAVQETFLCVVKWLHTYDSRYSFRTWLWTILLNQCHRQLKKGARAAFLATGNSSVRELPAGPAAMEEIASQLSDTPGPAYQLLAKERAELLDTLLRQLPDVQADAIRLRFFAGLQFQEIATATNCCLSTAKNRVRWGLLKLAELLGPTGEFASWSQALGGATDADDH